MEPTGIIGLLFTGATIATLLGLHLSKVTVPRVGSWMLPPPVRVSKSSGVKLRDVREAVRFWRGQGFPIGPVELTDDVTGPVPGQIFIGLPNSAWSGAGRASWRVDYPVADDEQAEFARDSAPEQIMGPMARGQVLGAVINLSPGLTRSEMLQTLKHELGHALGFLHCQTGQGHVKGRMTGHVMNPWLSKAGDKTNGIHHRA